MATFNPNGRKAMAPYPSFFTPPAGREIAGGIKDKYGAGTVTRSVGSVFSRPGALAENEAILGKYQTPGTTANVTHGGAQPAAVPEIGATPFPTGDEPPAAVPFPGFPEDDAGSDPFAGDAAQKEETIDSLDAREAAALARHSAAIEASRAFREQPAILNPPQIAAPQGAAPQVASAPTPKFIGFKSPLAFSSGWKPAASGGAPNATAQQPPEFWAFGTGLDQKARKDADRNDPEAMRKARAGNQWEQGVPDEPHQDSGQTTRFYEGIQDRWEKNGRRGVAPRVYKHYR